MTPRIQKAIDIFLDAINEGTLAKGTCSACAVGNLVAAGIGYRITDLDPMTSHKCKINTHWSDIFTTYSGGYQRVTIHAYKNAAKENVDCTDFTFLELARIEKVFENNTQIHYRNYSEYSPQQIRQDQIRGLEAVVQVMLEFDECPEPVQEVFTIKAQTLPV